jgi:hypothetical protein
MGYPHTSRYHWTGLGFSILASLFPRIVQLSSAAKGTWASEQLAPTNRRLHPCSLLDRRLPVRLRTQIKNGPFGVADLFSADRNARWKLKSMSKSKRSERRQLPVGSSRLPPDVLCHRHWVW